MAALEFLRLGKRRVHALHFDHGTEHGKEARDWVESYCESRGIPLTVGRVSGVPAKGGSVEAWWREQRYSFLECSSPFQLIVTAHHLNDAVENWLMTAIRGNPEVIPPQRGRFIRPFIATHKADLESWARSRGVPWLTDPTNAEEIHDRNYIRKNVVPHALTLNPGIDKVIRKKVMQLAIS